MPIFTAFLNKMKAAFRRIASATKNEVTAEDLQQEAWLIADEIATKRGQPIDFANADDASLVMRSVNHRHVKRGDWKLRKAVRIDKEVELGDGTASFVDLLQAQPSSDPLVALLHRESAIKAEELLAFSYSQAAAYVTTFVFFKNDRQQVCEYLVLTASTLNKRVANAAHSVRTQPSLFDRIEKIGSTFMPRPGLRYALRIEQAGASTQWGWDF